MPKNISSQKPRELIRMLSKGGCSFFRTGKGDHEIYVRVLNGKKRIVPIDMGAGEMSPAYVLRILRQFGFTDADIEDLMK